MDPSPSANLLAPLRAWLQERHSALREQMTLSLSQDLARWEPDPELLARLSAAATAGHSSADSDMELGLGLDLLDSAPTQGEVLHRLLDALAPFAQRVALFILKQGLLSPFAARGFEGESPRQGALVPPAELEALIQGRLPYIDQANEAYAALLGAHSKVPAPALRIIPLRLKRKVVAVLLVDSGRKPELDRLPSIRALVRTAEACLSHLSGAKEEERAAPVETPPNALTQRIPEVIQTAPPEDLDPKVRATAERLARVLVGDIELYCPQQVIDGRAKGNLYVLLREELERSRATFLDRFGLDVETRHQIFYKTLVDLLCEGDASKLKGAPWAI